jgi:hypothetical protein
MGVGAALAWYKKKKNKNLKGYKMDWIGPHPEFKCLYGVI